MPVLRRAVAAIRLVGLDDSATAGTIFFSPQYFFFSKPVLRRAAIRLVGFYDSATAGTIFSPPRFLFQSLCFGALRLPSGS
jgi:hypothetical protein